MLTRDIGKVRVPPLPQYIGLTDRDDGTVWVLSHSADKCYFTIRDDITFTRDRKDIVVYGAYEGPVVGNAPRIRLYARARHIGYEIVPFGGSVTDIDNARITSRLRHMRFVREVIRPDGFRVGHGLAHKGISFGG